MSLSEPRARKHSHAAAPPPHDARSAQPQPRWRFRCKLSARLPTPMTLAHRLPTSPTSSARCFRHQPSVTHRSSSWRWRMSCKSSSAGQFHPASGGVPEASQLQLPPRRRVRQTIHKRASMLLVLNDSISGSHTEEHRRASLARVERKAPPGRLARLRIEVRAVRRSRSKGCIT